jgi:hypothetical protein
MLNLYVFCSLTVSGNSVFSMKTAALLWLLVGNVRSDPGETEAAVETPVPTAALHPTLRLLSAKSARG